VQVAKPDCWDLKQVKDFSDEYPWLFFSEKNFGCKYCKNTNSTLLKSKGVHCAKEWVNG